MLAGSYVDGRLTVTLSAAHGAYTILLARGASGDVDAVVCALTREG